MAAPDGAIPNVAAILGPLLARVPAEQRPLLLAIAERLAADRYRSWADTFSEPGRKAELMACAEREEQIAARVEALFPDASAVQAELLASNPDLADVNRSLFAERPLAQQLAIQAQGERAGSATWQAFAAKAQPEVRDTYLACAALEERSAAVLEAILQEGL